MPPTIEVVLGDITERVDAVVTAANGSLHGGGRGRERFIVLPGLSWRQSKEEHRWIMTAQARGSHEGP